MKKLEDMTPDELRRYADDLEEDNRIKTIPKPLNNIDLKEITDHCDEILRDYAINGKGDEGDEKQYLYETVMTTIYGTSVWNWINKQ